MTEVKSFSKKSQVLSDLSVPKYYTKNKRIKWNELTPYVVSCSSCLICIDELLEDVLHWIITEQGTSKKHIIFSRGREKSYCFKWVFLWGMTEFVNPSQRKRKLKFTTIWYIRLLDNDAFTNVTKFSTYKISILNPY